MREPRIPMQVVRHLRLRGTVRLHAERLHPPRTFRIEPDEFATAVVFRAVIQPERRRETRLVAAHRRNRVDIVTAVPLGAISERLPVRRNAVEVARRKRRHQARQATVKVNLVNARKPVFFRMVANVNTATVRIEHVVVIAVIDKVTLHKRNLARRHRIPVNAAVAVVREERPVRAPVRRLDHAVEFLEHLDLARLDIEHLQNGLIAAAVPRFARRNLERKTHADAFANLVHQRHELHRLRMRHLRTLPHNTHRLPTFLA